AQQHARALAHFAADRVAAPVQAVAEVHVQVPGLAEHGGVARGHAAIRMRRGILAAGVGLHLDDAPRAAIVADQELVEQFGRDQGGMAAVERTRHRRPSGRQTARHRGPAPFWPGARAGGAWTGGVSGMVKDWRGAGAPGVNAGSRDPARRPWPQAGAACPIRTDDLPLTRRLLYQLS